MGLLVAWLLACGGGASVHGEVVDVAGKPLDGVVVTVVGSLCQDNTDASGKFELSCNPSEMLITVTQAGYISKEIELEATKEKDYDLGRITLIAIPKSHGLFVFDGSDYASMEGGFLVRDLDKRRKTKTFCIDPDNSKPNAVKAGTVGMFDNEYRDWRIWRLDDEGCAYRMSMNAEGRWKTEYAEKPSQSSQSVATEKEVVVLDLAKGKYFVADWDRGFFVKTKKKVKGKKSKSDKDDAPRYSGYLLVAE